jgi:type I restriction enzyme S subunit
MSWDMVPIGTVVRSAQYGLSLAVDIDGTLPIVGMKDIQGGRVRVDPAVCVSLSQGEAIEYLLSDGDILLNRTNSPDLVGKAGIFRGKEPAVFASYLVRLKLDRERVDPDFIIQILNSAIGQRRIKRLSTRAISQANLNPTVFRRKFQIPLPSLREQESVRDILLTWDCAIERTDQLVVAKQQRYEALSRRLLFGKTRLGDHEGSITKALHWFAVPDDWRVVKIGDISREVSLINASDQSLPVLSCTKHRGLVESLEYFGKQVFSHDTSKYKLARHCQFVYATNHIDEGSIGYQDKYPMALVSPIYTVFESNHSDVEDRFLYKLLKTEAMRCVFQARTNASVDRRGGLRWKEFAQIPIPIPSTAEQREICAVLDEAKREIDLLLASSDALKEQKRGLMQKLLTGQWRVGANGEAQGT